MPKPEKHVFVCSQTRPDGHPRGCCAQRKAGATCCRCSGRNCKSANLFDKISVTYSGCLGPCDGGPNVVVYPEGVMYSQGHERRRGGDLRRVPAGRYTGGAPAMPARALGLNAAGAPTSLPFSAETAPRVAALLAEAAATQGEDARPRPCSRPHGMPIHTAWRSTSRSISSISIAAVCC